MTFEDAAEIVGMERPDPRQALETALANYRRVGSPCFGVEAVDLIRTARACGWQLGDQPNNFSIAPKVAVWAERAKAKRWKVTCAERAGAV